MIKRRDENIDVSTLGGRLRKRRRELGWTQMYLAERVGTSQAVIQKIENGKSLRPRILEEIAEALSVRPSWLMFGVQEVGGLEPEALELARAWSKLQEPHTIVASSVCVQPSSLRRIRNRPPRVVGSGALLLPWLLLCMSLTASGRVSIISPACSARLVHRRPRVVGCRRHGAGKLDSITCLPRLSVNSFTAPSQRSQLVATRSTTAVSAAPSGGSTALSGDATSCSKSHAAVTTIRPVVIPAP